jgi:Na+/phosphate symporter
MNWKHLGKVILSLIAFIFFVLGILLMQMGSFAFVPFLREHLEVEATANALGFGWIASYILLSGSPVAAMAVTFFASGQIGEGAAFAMIMGSRIGAAFIVLFIGFFYYFWYREMMRELRVGFLALMITLLTYLPALILGFVILKTGFFFESVAFHLPDSGIFSFLLSGTTEKVEEIAQNFLPSWGWFLVGLAFLMLCFKLFDLSLPSIDPRREKEVKGIRRYILRKWPMFGLGMVLTMISMSVSITLSLLIPLHHRRLIQSRHAIPFILGANISTFLDTLLAALFVDRPETVVIVLLGIASVSIVTLILLFIYTPFEETMINTLTWVTGRPRNLLLVISALFLIPLVLILL